MVQPTSRPGSPLWLTHHHDDQLDRCAVVAGHHVCRRCLWFWPATAAFVAELLEDPDYAALVTAYEDEDPVDLDADDDLGDGPDGEGR